MRDIWVKAGAAVLAAGVIGAFGLLAWDSDVAALRIELDTSNRTNAAAIERLRGDLTRREVGLEAQRNRDRAFKRRVLDELTKLMVEVAKLAATQTQKPGAPTTVDPPQPEHDIPDTIEPPPDIPDREVIEYIERLRREVERLVRERERDTDQ